MKKTEKTQTVVSRHTLTFVADHLPPTVIGELRAANLIPRLPRKKGETIQVLVIQPQTDLLRRVLQLLHQQGREVTLSRGLDGFAMDLRSELSYLLENRNATALVSLMATMLDARARQDRANRESDPQFTWLSGIQTLPTSGHLAPVAAR